jgi:hypothetical protein
MPQVSARSFVTMTAALLVGIVFMPAPADAAKLTKAEKVAWSRANVSCKAEAKGKKVKWLQRRKFVRGCIVETLKGYPNINVEKIMKEMDTGKLPATLVDNPI